MVNSRAMSTNTPNKIHGDGENTNWYSPVILPDSPAAVASQKNVTGLPRVARDIAADVYNNIQRWNDMHIRGATLAKSVARLKSENVAPYPPGLEDLTSDLYNCVQKLSGISSALEFLASQMCSLVKLHKKPTPMFVSLNNEQLAGLVLSISEAYKAEFKVKEYVLQNIAHTNNKNEVMFYAICWTHQQNITNEINLKLESLLTETGHRKIN